MSQEATAKSAAERFLVFSLSNEEFGVPLLKVKEVIALTEITPVPYTPVHFKGIMNLRGQVISVIDLRLKFKMSKAETKSENVIIILDVSPLSFGVIVDAVDLVLAVQPADIQAPPDIESTIKSDYLIGVIRKEKKLVLLLDIEKTLSSDDLRSMQNKNKAS